MKHLLACLLALGLLCSAAVPVLGEEALAPVGSFELALEKQHISYSAAESDSLGTEMVTFTITHETFGELDVRLYFRKDALDCTIVVWDLLTSQSREAVLPLLNELNSSSPLFTFVFDESDASVYLFADPIFTEENCAQICLRYLDACYDALDRAAEVLQ